MDERSVIVYEPDDALDLLYDAKEDLVMRLLGIKTVGGGIFGGFETQVHPRVAQFSADEGLRALVRTLLPRTTRIWHVLDVVDGWESAREERQVWSRETLSNFELRLLGEIVVNAALYTAEDGPEAGLSRQQSILYERTRLDRTSLFVDIGGEDLTSRLNSGRFWEGVANGTDREHSDLGWYLPWGHVLDVLKNHPGDIRRDDATAFVRDRSDVVDVPEVLLADEDVDAYVGFARELEGSVPEGTLDTMLAPIAHGLLNKGRWDKDTWLAKRVVEREPLYARLTTSRYGEGPIASFVRQIKG